MSNSNRKSSKLTALALASTMLILLSSCSFSAEVNLGDSNKGESLKFVINDAVIEQEGLDFTEKINIVSDSEAEVLLYGSSSCPPVIENVFAKNESTLELHIKEYSGSCTADYAGYPKKITFENINLQVKEFLVCEYDVCREIEVLNSVN